MTASRAGGSAGAGFAALARRALHESGYSMRAAARAICYDVAYLSRVLNGKQPPSPQLAEALDRLLDADGALIAATLPEPALSPVCPPAASGVAGLTDTDGEIAFLRASTAHFAAHEARYGGDQIANAAARVWRDGHRKLLDGLVPEREERAYLTALGEAATLAAWVLFDADRWQAARGALLESLLYARLTGDPSAEQRDLVVLAQLEAERRHGREALYIAEELLTRPRVPPRVVSIAHGLRGAALALAGERRRSLEEMAASRAGLSRSLTRRDPDWVQMVPEAEVDGCHGAILLAADRPDAAALALRAAADGFAALAPEGRGELYYRISLLAAHAQAGAWRECETGLLAILPLLALVRSAYNRRRLRQTCQRLARDRRAPAWLTELARDVAAANDGLAVTVGTAP